MGMPAAGGISAGQLPASDQRDVQNADDDERNADRREIVETETVQPVIDQDRIDDDIRGRQKRRHAAEDRTEGERHQKPRSVDVGFFRRARRRRLTSRAG